MTAYSPFGSSSFRLVTSGLVALHQLGREGRDDSPEADSVRDAMDAPWNALNKAEMERAQWLSEDLYSVSEPSVANGQREMNSQAQQQLNDSIEARENREWDRALAFLRELKEDISPALLSYLRGRIWEEAGFPAVAAVFFAHAWENDQANAHYQAFYISALAESDPQAAGKLARQVLVDPDTYAPLVVAEAANIRFTETRYASDVHSAEVYRELITILEKNLTRIEAEGSTAIQTPEYEMTVGKLGICHELLGNAQAAVNYFSRGLRANPNNGGLLAARGILQYGSSPRAITDFEEAVRLDSGEIWPYFFLAHHYLATSRFEECRLMCESGLRRRGSEAAKSQLEEWRAIAQAALGFPLETVRAGFEAATRLDPSNDLARRNQDTFETCLKTSGARSSAWWEQKSDTAIKQLGLAERRYACVA